MKKRKMQSLNKRFWKELKTQERLRMKQFIESDDGGKSELLHRAKYATDHILKVAKPMIWSPAQTYVAGERVTLNGMERVIA